MGSGRGRWGEGPGGRGREPDDSTPEPEDGPGDALGRMMGGDFPEYGEYLGNERARAGQLALELLTHRAQIVRLEESLRHKETALWQQGQVVDGLKAELRAVGATMVALRAQMVALQAAAQGREVAPPVETAPPAVGEEAAALQASLADLEARLQEAVVLVLDEMNTRRAAEDRVRHLEDLWRTQGRTPPPPAP